MAANLIFKIFISYVLLSLGGCALIGSGGYSRYDERSVSVLTVSLFNQRTPSKLVKASWKGDWLFRRERLELVDRGLLEIRPDLLVFQQLMSRRGSPSESDQSILSYGSLDGYQWDLSLSRFYEDTQEEQFFALAMGLPIIASEAEPSTTGKLGIDGSYSINNVKLQKQDIWVVNVEMPTSAKSVDAWYKVLQKKLSEFQNSHNICSKRLLVAGYLPGRVSWPFYQDFLKYFELKDTSTGFCEVANDCATGTPMNELFLGTSEGKSGTQVDRIFAHQQAVVYSSKVALNGRGDGSLRSQNYGLEYLWPSRRFAWNSIVRLPRCN